MLEEFDLREGLNRFEESFVCGWAEGEGDWRVRVEAGAAFASLSASRSVRLLGRSELRKAPVFRRFCQLFETENMRSRYFKHSASFSCTSDLCIHRV